jgi:glycerol-3-phosphate responsive antiterminator
MFFFPDDLRLIIKTKEEKNVLLEEEVEELENYVKKVQDDSRRREMELLSEMDLIHGKNEVS